jgi:hypothetical protein
MNSRSLPYNFTRDRLIDEYGVLARELKAGEEIVFSGEVPEGLSTHYEIDSNDRGQMFFCGIPWLEKKGCPRLTIRRKSDGGR